METKRNPLNTQIAIVVVVAGLITGIVIAWHLTRPEAAPRYTPEYRVVDPGSAEAATLPDDVAAADPAGASPSMGADAPSAVPGAQPSGPERIAVQGAEEIMAREGTTERAELTEELYIRLSAEVVIFTSALQQQPNSDDVPEMQRLIAEFTGRLLAEHHVDPDDYYQYTQWVASDHERARQIGEKILRAAEKRTQIRIKVHDVPGLAPAPVAPPDN